MNVRSGTFSLILRKGSKVAKLPLDVKDCLSKPLKITGINLLLIIILIINYLILVDLVKESEKTGLKFSVNKTSKFKALEMDGIEFDGGFRLGPFHGCLSNIEINGKTPILNENHSAKGDNYSLTGCPKL